MCFGMGIKLGHHHPPSSSASHLCVRGVLVHGHVGSTSSSNFDEEGEETG